ncbi:MAG: DUF6683 family protein [Lysobacteraceae bacterium]
MKRVMLSLCAAALAWLFVPAAQSQQFGFVQPGFFGDISLNQSVSSATRSHVLGQYGEKDDGFRPGPGLANFAIREDVQAVQGARRAMAASISRSSGVPRDEVAQILSSGTLQAEFSTMVRAYRLDPADFADVVTAHYVVMWQIVNGANDPTQAAVAAARDQMRAALSSNPGIRSMDNHALQREAETMILLTMLGAAIYEPQRRAGNQVAVREAQAVVHEYMLAQGFDMKSVALGPQGIQAR